MAAHGALPIGWVAKRYGISHDTLRLYDKKGLLRPLVDPQTGYRSYSLEHLAQLDMIMAGRRLGVPLARLQQAFATRDLADHEALLRDQMEAVRERIEDLKQVQAYLAQMLPVVEAARRYPDGYAFVLEEPLCLAEVMVEDLLAGDGAPVQLAGQDEFLRFDPDGEGAFYEDEARTFYALDPAVCEGLGASVVMIRSGTPCYGFRGTLDQIRGHVAELASKPPRSVFVRFAYCLPDDHQNHEYLCVAYVPECE